MVRILTKESPDLQLEQALRAVVGDSGVIDRPDELLVYECDGYTLEKAVPAAVVLPRSTAEVAEVVRLLHAHRIPFVPRGAGTSLAGGTVSPPGAVVIGLSRMKRILAVDPLNRFAVVEAGVVNLALTRAVEAHGLLYAPDPSSQPACTIGGNIATNSGGPHTLKYGVTTNHVLGVKLVLPDGEVAELGGPVAESPGYDLTGLVIGNEGTFGIVTEATVRLIHAPQSVRTFLAVFESVADASRAVSGIVGAGIIPAALEMMDQLILRAVEEAFHVGFPLDAGAVLLIEIDGIEAGLEELTRRIEAVCRAAGMRSFRTAQDAAERQALWKARKRAFGAIGRLAPNYCTQDGVVPRSRLPEILERIQEIGRRHGLTIPNVFHAGDGNLHPILLYDERDSEQVKQVLAASREILEACIELGGSVTGEHGIGVEKISMLERMFSPDDLAAMRQVRDVFNPDGLANPNKIFATGAGCLEPRRPGRQAPL
jgi:glycolate oxidase